MKKTNNKIFTLENAINNSFIITKNSKNKSFYSRVFAYNLTRDINFLSPIHKYALERVIGHDNELNEILLKDKKTEKIKIITNKYIDLISNKNKISSLNYSLIQEHGFGGGVIKAKLDWVDINNITITNKHTNQELVSFYSTLITDDVNSFHKNQRFNDIVPICIIRKFAPKKYYISDGNHHVLGVKQISGDTRMIPVIKIKVDSGKQIPRI